MISCQSHLIITILCLSWINIIPAQDAEDSCSLSVLHQCGQHETCEQRSPSNSTGFCTCMKGYHRLEPGKDCIVVNPAPSPEPITASPDPSSVPVPRDNSHIVVGVMVPLTLLAIVLLIIYAGQRYNWVQRIRAMRQRRYDEVQFGQDDDDPPLA